MRKFGPKRADHPSVGELCPACKKPFQVGDFTTLVALGPGDDPEAQERAREKAESTTRLQLKPTGPVSQETPQKTLVNHIGRKRVTKFLGMIRYNRAILPHQGV